MDLDGDGIADLISGSWPGEIYFFKGKGKGTFDAPVKLRHADGKAVNPGGGRRNSGDMILIAGDATFEKEGDKQFVVYEGERIEIPEGQDAGITGTASAVHAFDWDGDGKPDLLVGNINGRVYLVPNQSTPKGLAFGKARPLEAGGTPLEVPHGDSGPYVADWDGDGKPDLVVGAGDGSVWLYRNTGTAKEPKLAAGVQLVAKSEAGFGNETPKQALPGVRAKVCVVDWDGDGRPDLLVGDFAMQKPDRPEPSAAEKAEHDKLRKEMEAANARFAELYSKLRGPEKVKDKEGREKVQKELQELNQRRMELYKKLPPDQEQHGWVWLYKRKPAGSGKVGG